MIEAFLIKIAIAVFKKATIGSMLAKILSAYEIYAIFQDLTDCVESINSCDELKVCGVKVVSDVMTSACMERLITIGNMTFEVSRHSSGIYIASSITPRFLARDLRFPSIGRLAFPEQSFRNDSTPQVPEFLEEMLYDRHNNRALCSLR